MKNWLFELLVYHPETVTNIRIGLAVVGAILVAAAVGARLIRRQDVMLMSDRAAVRLFAVALVAFPILCMMVACSTNCDFFGFQAAGSLLLAMTGTCVAIRAKRKWYILLYVFLFLMVGALSPAV